MSLTGIKDVDLLILEKLGPNDINSMMLVNWTNYRLCQLVCKKKLENGYPTFLKYKEEPITYFSYYKYICDSMIIDGVDHERKIPLRSWLLDYYIENGNLILVKFLYEKGVQWLDFDLFKNITDINMIKFLMEKYGDKITNPLLKYIENCAEDLENLENLEIIKYFVEECGEEITKDVLISAIINDHLEILKYFIDVRRVPFNKKEFICYENHKNVNVMEYILTTHEKTSILL